jgi:TolB-like protein/Flp pilus assembly protein TadD
MSLFAPRRRTEAPPATPAAVRSELNRLLASDGFASSDRQRRLLTFVVEESLAGRGATIKESVLAVEVFGREPSFDPRTDSVVRSEARNLRARLNEYYRGEGSRNPVVIEIPKGSYAPVFRPVPAATPRRGRSYRLAAVAVLAVTVGAAALWLAAGRRAGGNGLRSIAVLPFLSLAGDPGNDYAADGFVEDLTTEFGQIRELRVAARTSAFQYRGKSQDVRKIGRELDVAAVLEGSYRQDRGRFKVNAQLIDARSGYHLWSESYERQSGEVEAVEAEILSAVSKALGARPLAAGVRARATRPEAREAYWQGRYLKTQDWLHAGAAGIPYFERAVAADPQYAEAWAALASTHSNMAFHGEGEVADEVAKGKAAAARALELDEAIPESHLARANLTYYWDNDWQLAEREYQRALDLNPSHAGGHRSFALELTALGRHDEALRHLELAGQLDPISIQTTNNLAAALYCARRYDEAIRVARKHLEVDPKFFPARETIGECDAAMGKYGEAVAEIEKVRAEAGDPLMVLGALGNTYAHAGRLSDARSILSQLEQIQKSEGIAGVALAMVHLGLGEKAQAVQCLRQAASAHIADVLFIGVNPYFDPLRGDPGFEALSSKLGFQSGRAQR